MLRYSVILLSLFVVHIAAAAVPDDKNLVKNPGFEDVKDGKLVGWSVAGFSEGGKGTIAPSNDKPHAGKTCAHIKGTGDWGTFVSDRIPVQKGKTYELKGFVRVAKGKGYIKFDYFKGDMYIGMTMGEQSESTDWVEQTILSELSANPDATHLTATLVGGDGEYEAWFDDISIVEKK